MIEAVVLGNQLNSTSHWDFPVDPEWSRFTGMVRRYAPALEGVRWS